MFKKKECVALLLAGGQGSRLHALTAKTAKPAVTFGGKYRIIDFPLSNCVHSGIDTVGVLTQYQPGKTARTGTRARPTPFIRTCSLSSAMTPTMC